MPFRSCLRWHAGCVGGATLTTETLFSQDVFMTKIQRMVWGTAFAGMMMLGTANAVTFSASSGSLSASATFEVSGTSTLTITLANTSLADVTAPNQVLTAVFFDTVPNMTLTPESAILGGGSSVLFFGTVPGGNVGGEWAYGANLSDAPGGAQQGTSSTGLGLFGSGNFDGGNLQGPASVDGLQFGITSLGDNPLTGNTPVTGQYALIKGSVVFTLSGFSPLSGTIQNVRFLYGTSLDDTILTGDSPPTPDGGSTLLLLGLTLVGFGILRRKIGRA